jgi:hypothetical protein
MRCRIQISPDHCSFASSPEHFGGYTVFLRLCMPSHPPYTLSSLTTLISNRSTSTPVKACQNRHPSPCPAWYSNAQRQMKVQDRGRLPQVTMSAASQWDSEAAGSLPHAKVNVWQQQLALLTIVFGEMWNHSLFGVSPTTDPPGR